MSPKEKAKELVHKFMISLYGDFQPDLSHPKQCALVAVDEIINNQMSMRIYWDNIEVVENVKYLQEVKQEIEKL